VVTGGQSGEQGLELIGGRYRVLREIGRGGNGIVYEVEHIHTTEHLALKLVVRRGLDSAEFFERFRREARTWARLDHEHVVRIVDADASTHLEAPYLVMELLDGASFATLSVERGRISPEIVLDLMSQVALAIDHAHDAGIVHRDLKPENLFLHVRADGRAVVKILDWGIAKLIDGETTDLTRTGMILGTPHFMAPEQAVGRLDAIGRAADIWAVGLVATNLLTADDYWSEDSTGKLLLKVGRGPDIRPRQRWPWLPAAFDTWFKRSCSRDPSKRWANVTEQIEGLRAVFETSLRAGGASSSERLGAWMIPSRDRGRMPVEPVEPVRPITGEETLRRRRRSLEPPMPETPPPRRPAALLAAALSALAIAAGLSWIAVSGAGAPERAHAALIASREQPAREAPKVTTVTDVIDVPGAPTAPAASASAEVAAAPSPDASDAGPSAVEESPKKLVATAQTNLNRGGRDLAIEARELAERATELDATSAEAWLTLGAACDAVGDHRSALQAYAQCASSARGPGVRECRALVR
jgi:tRNA A-37 threonylcarbamoyl transferase component Bud32